MTTSVGEKEDRTRLHKNKNQTSRGIVRKRKTDWFMMLNIPTAKVRQKHSGKRELTGKKKACCLEFFRCGVQFFQHFAIDRRMRTHHWLFGLTMFWHWRENRRHGAERETGDARKSSRRSCGKRERRRGMLSVVPSPLMLLMLLSRFFAVSQICAM